MSRKGPDKGVFIVYKKFLFSNLVYRIFFIFQCNFVLSLEFFQVEIDPHKVAQVDVDVERPDDVGGIDIAKAKEKMKAEDEIDKQIYRQKIKQKHRVSFNIER